MDLYENIKALRAAKGVSQAEIARKLEIDPSAYHRLEHRGNKISIEQAESIASALGVSLIELLTWGQRKDDYKDNSEAKDEIKPYQERINELEDRLKDKIKIISTLERELKDVSKLIAVRIRDRIDLTALQKNIGTVVIKYRGRKESSTISAQEYNNSKTLMPYENPYLYSTVLTHEEIRTVFFQLMKSSIFHDVMETVIHEGLLEDDELEELYMEYFNVKDQL
ncbi:hypothetical protein GCM10028807_24070 [Spirosoma daeguense]